MPAQQTHYVPDTFLADRYGVNRSTIWRWVQSGRLPAPIELSPGCTRWKLSDIESAESSGMRPSKHPYRGRKNAAAGTAAIRSATTKFKTLWPICCDVDSAYLRYLEDGSLQQLLDACAKLSLAVESLSHPTPSQDTKREDTA